jgi:hypothetical protein
MKGPAAERDRDGISTHPAILPTIRSRTDLNKPLPEQDQGPADIAGLPAYSEYFKNN